MQNQESNHQPGGFSKILKERGYYILLALCVLAVGISGYVFISSAVRQNQASQETLSVPVTAQDPAHGAVRLHLRPCGGRDSGHTGHHPV